MNRGGSLGIGGKLFQVRRLLPSVLVIGVLVAILAAGRASAAPDWLAPWTLSAPSSGAYDPAVVVGPQGNALTIWRRFDGSRQTIEAARRPPGDPWAMPEDLSAAGEPAEAPQIALNGAGDAVAVWETYEGGHHFIQAAERPAGGSWTAAQRLSALTESAYGPRVAIDAAGDAVAVWQGSEAGRHFIQAAERRAGGSWAPAQRLSALADLAEAPQVALNGAGDAVTVWETYEGGQFAVQAAERPMGGDWSAAHDLANEGEPGEPQVAIDAAGDAVAVWQGVRGGYYVIQTAERPVGGSWTAAQDLSSKAEPSEAPQLAVDAAGDATAVWQSYVGGYFVIQTAERPVGGSWTAPQDLSDRYLAPQHQSARQAQIALDQSGDAVVVWGSYAATYYVIQATQRPVGGSWSAVQNLSSEGVDAHNPKVAINPVGDAVAVWEGDEGGSRVIQAAAYDTTGPRLDNLSIPANGVAGRSLVFSSAPHDLWSTVKSTTWSFGDGTKGLGDSVRHTYAAKGTYTVTVTSVDASGNASSETATVSIAEAPRGLAVAARRVPVKRGTALLKLRCQGEFGGCQGAAKLIATGPKEGGRGNSSPRIQLGKRRFSIPANRAAVIRIRLTGRGRSLLDRDGDRRLPVLLAGSGLKHGRVELRLVRP